MKFLQNVSNPKTKSNIWFYFLGATIFTAVCWIPAMVIAEMNNYEVLSPSTFGSIYTNGFESWVHFLLSMLFSLGVYGPMIFGFLATAREGKQETSFLWKSMRKWDVKVYWYLYIPLVATLLVLPAFLIGLITNLLNFSDTYFTVEIFIAFFVFQLVTSGLEEPGWRGYLLPRLLEHYNAEQASLRLGVLWAIWHWPFVIYVTLIGSEISPSSADYPLVMTLMIVQTLFFFSLSTVGISIIYTWIHVNTRSVFLAILFHAMSNLTSTFFQSFASPALSVVIGASPWLIAAYLLKRYGKETLLMRPRAVSPSVFDGGENMEISGS